MHSFTKSRFYIPKPHIESLMGAEVCLIESLLFSKQLEQEGNFQTQRSLGRKISMTQLEHAAASAPHPRPRSANFLRKF